MGCANSVPYGRMWLLSAPPPRLPPPSPPAGIAPNFKVTGFLVFPFAATPKSSPGPDYLCWDDTLPDVRGHQRKAGADGGPHELSSGRTLSVPRAHGPRAGFCFCFCCVLFCFVFCIMYFLSAPINFFDLYFFSHYFLSFFFPFEILFMFLCGRRCLQ